MASLRIGVNALYMIPGGVGGTEIYLRSLLGALERLETDHRFVVFVNEETEGGLAPQSPRFDVIRTGVRATNRPRRLTWEQLRLPRELRKHRIDVLFNPGFTAPVFAPCPTVTVFHDLQHKRHPENFRWFDLPFWKRSSMLRRIAAAGSSRSRTTTKHDFIATTKWMLRASAWSTMASIRSFSEFANGIREMASQRYVLTVSTLHPHKNFLRLLLAYAEFAQERPDVNLVMAGMRGFEAAEIERVIAECGLGEKVRCTGWIPRQELYALFAGADAFIYPTSFEGFGMTLLEGLAAGLPVACSAIEPVRTLAGDAALRFDPQDVAAIESAMVRITDDEELRARLARPDRRGRASFAGRRRRGRPCRCWWRRQGARHF